MRLVAKFTVRLLIDCFMLPILLVTAIVASKKRDTLFWGPTPILNNKYWSNAVKGLGLNSMTLMSGHYPINKRADFDLYYEDLLPKFLRRRSLFTRVLGPYLALLHLLRKAIVVHLPFHGGPLGATTLWRFEAFIYRLAGIKTVLLAYGADAYMYSTIIDPSLRHALQMSYPLPGRFEEEVKVRVNYWCRNADIVLSGFSIDGFGRWDSPVFSTLVIDTEEWRAARSYTSTDGRNGVVKVLHAPNHRGFKGTEFLISAIEELKAEGLLIELVLLEGVPNSTVKELIRDSDILAEQFIATGYALNAVEGMASGLPVLSNLDSERCTRMYRRYSYLNECPILSTCPETLKRNLRVLISRPSLRKELGEAGRRYVEKYHSYATAQYLFGSIYGKILHGKSVDLMNLFHPLKSPYNRATPRVRHPLFENRLPPDYPLQC